MAWLFLSTEHAPSSRGIPAVFHSPPGGRATFLCVAEETWPKERPSRCSGLRAFGKCSCVAEGAFDTEFGAHDAGYLGPLDRGETAEYQPAGWPTGRGPVRRHSRDGLSANPAAGSRALSTGTERRARCGGGISLAYFSFGHAKRSKTLAMEGEWERQDVSTRSAERHKPSEVTGPLPQPHPKCQ